MVSIIIPTYNQNEILDDCINSIRKHTKDYELVIIDNGSSPAYDTKHLTDVSIQLIRNEENFGFPKAINQGIEIAKGEIVVLLNNDVIVTSNWLERLVKALDEFDIVGPLTNYCSGHQQVLVPSYNNEEELNAVVESWTSVCIGKIFETNWVIGFCMAFRKSLFDVIGKFDDSLWPCSGEEIDFCMRAKDKDYKVGICCDVYVHHHGSQTFTYMQKNGILNYKNICERNERHLNKMWGRNFLINQEARVCETRIS